MCNAIHSIRELTDVVALQTQSLSKHNQYIQYIDTAIDRHTQAIARLDEVIAKKLSTIEDLNTSLILALSTIDRIQKKVKKLEANQRVLLDLVHKGSNNESNL